MPNFAQIAPHLANPFILIGFVLLLLFGIHRALIKSEILQPVDRKTSGIIVLSFLRYGFWIGILLIVFSFTYSEWMIYREAKPTGPVTTINTPPESSPKKPEEVKKLTIINREVHTIK